MSLFITSTSTGFLIQGPAEVAGAQGTPVPGGTLIDGRAELAPETFGGTLGPEQRWRSDRWSKSAMREQTALVELLKRHIDNSARFR